MSTPGWHRDPGDLAIVGMSCRFPGANSVDSFWRNLLEGRESITSLTDDQLLQAGVPRQVFTRPDYVRFAPMLEGIDGFDAALFGYLPKEAALIAPQQRLFLEVAFEAFERAGYPPRLAESRNIGVYCGGGSIITSYMLAHANLPAMHGQTAGLEHISNDNDFLATRVSYKLNLGGPSLTVQTACSTSLVAVHLACQALRSGDCDMALTGAAAVRVPHAAGYIAEKGNVHSSDGHCRPFDAGATGTIFGSGVVAILLKPLDRALADGDHVVAVIKGSGVNNDGEDKQSYAAPSSSGQTGAMRRALAAAGVDARSIGYVECHATGTTIGDPLEIEALTAAFRADTADSGFCAVGSVKSNIGHPEQAAGLAGLLKVALALEHGTLPPTANLAEVNPRIPFAGSPFYPLREATAWPADGTPRRAAVNSLGIGGTNAFVILEEAPVRADVARSPDRPRLMCLSAASETALAAYCERLAPSFHDAADLSALVGTINRSRSGLRHRLALVGSDTASLRDQLAAYAARTPGRPTSHRGSQSGVVFLFSGQGAQHPGMGKALYGAVPAFRQHLDAIVEALQPHVDRPLLPLMFDAGGGELLRQTGYAQPALFALELALARTWQTFGIVPAAVLGHSLGELTAACVAGVLSEPDAARLVGERAAAMQRAPGGGAMVAVAADEAEVRAVLAEVGSGAEIASFNAPRSQVVSGPEADVARTVAAFEARGVRCTRLAVSHAFHSAMMEPALEPFAGAIAGLDFAPPRIELASNLTGQVLAGAPDAGYWREQIRRPVRFQAALSALVASGYRTFLEIGPAPALAGLAMQTLAGEQAGRCWPSLNPQRGEVESLLEAAGHLYGAGLPVDPVAVNGEPVATVPLPTYPFEHRRFWVGTAADAGRTQVAAEPAPQPSAPVAAEVPPPSVSAPDTRRAVFAVPRTLAARDFALADHLVCGLPVAPTTALLQVAADAADFSGGALEIRDFVYHEALLVPQAAPVELTLSFETSGDRRTFRILASRSGADGDLLHASGSIGGTAMPSGPTTAPADPPAQPAMDGETLYATLVRHGLSYGPRYRRVETIWVGQDRVRARLCVERGSASTAWDLVELDAALHGYPLLIDAEPDTADVHLPVGFRALRVARTGAIPAWTELVRTAADPGAGSYRFDARVTDAAGATIAIFEGLEVRRRPPAALRRQLLRRCASWLFAPRWHPAAAPAGAFAETRWVVIGEPGPAAALSECLSSAIAPEVIVPDLSGWPFHDLRARLRAVRGNRDSLAGIVLLGPATDEDAAPARPKTLDRALERSVGAGLAAVQVLVADEAVDLPPLYVVTRGAQPADAGDAVLPVGAALWGFARTLGLEHPRLACRCIDLDAAQPAADQWQALGSELATSSPESGVALRRTGRFVLRLAHAELPVAAHEGLRADASYLITGGLGTLGLEMAMALGRDHGARCLVLTGRSPPGERQRARIEEIERLGCAVHVVNTDVSKRRGVDRLMARIAELPPLRGVVHLAGVLADGVIANQDWAAFSRSLAPKARAAWLLDRATTDCPLDFFALQSSILGVLGSAGQANYAAANAYLDALAASRRAAGRCASVIDWGPWSGGGMADAGGERGESIWRHRGVGFIDPPTGAGLFGGLLESGFDQLAVAPMDWSRYLRWTGSGSAYFDGLLPEAAAGAHRQTVNGSAGGGATADLQTVTPAMEHGGSAGAGSAGNGAAPAAANGAGTDVESEVADEVLREVHACVADELGFDEAMDVDQPLNELGLDSLMSVNLSNRIELESGVSIPVAELIEGPTIRELAERVAAENGRARPSPALDVIEVDVTSPRPAAPTGAAARRQGNPWLVRPRPNEDARARLVCFPYAGGGATVYRPWAELLHPDIELIAIEPPGRAGRVSEPPIDRLEPYLEQLVGAVRTLRDKPVAFFGHCLGGLNMYQAVQRLRREGSVDALHVFASGSRPPHLVRGRGDFEAALFRDLLRLPGYEPLRPLHDQPDDVFAFVIRRFDIGATNDWLAHQELAQVLLPAVRADFAITEDYHPGPVEPWDLPITCFAGLDDPYVTRAQSQAWAPYTNSEFRILFRRAAHFIIHDDRAFIVDTINRTLDASLAAPTGSRGGHDHGANR